MSVHWRDSPSRCPSPSVRSTPGRPKRTAPYVPGRWPGLRAESPNRPGGTGNLEATALVGDSGLADRQRGAATVSNATHRQRLGVRAHDRPRHGRCARRVPRWRGGVARRLLCHEDRSATAATNQLTIVMAPSVCDQPDVEHFGVTPAQRGISSPMESPTAETRGRPRR